MICKECGIHFTPKNRGRKNNGFCCHYCSDKYRKKRQIPKFTNICKHCGRSYMTNNSEQQYCSYACRGAGFSGRTIYEKECEYCKNIYTTIIPKQRFCTAACGSRANAEKMRKEKLKICEYCGVQYYNDHPEQRRFCSKKCYRAFQNDSIEKRRLELEEERTRRLTTQCPICGTVFIAKYMGTLYCSDRCKAIASAHHVPITYRCKGCGEQVVTEYGDKKRIFCSVECQRRYFSRIYKKLRKEQIRESYVEPVNLVRVYRRDKGICQICGLPVPFNKEPENIWGATIDHIIPLSRNGLHSMRNSQIAHRICNSLKSNQLDFQVDWEEMLQTDGTRWREIFNDLLMQLDGETCNLSQIGG